MELVKNVLVDERLLRLGVTKFIDWSPDAAPHCAACGPTGSGKTYFSKILLSKAALAGAEITVCDYKGDSDFQFLTGCPRFFRFSECQAGLQQFYDQFLARQRGDDDSDHRRERILFFDEFSSYCNSFESSKLLDTEKRKIANILQLGRSFSTFLCASQQRFDAQYWNTARDNFQFVVGLGELSVESKSMLFQGFQDQMEHDRGRGAGYLLISGSQLIPVRVATVENTNRLHELIREAVTR